MHTHTSSTQPRSRARIGALSALGALGLVAAALLGPASPAHAHDQLIDTVIETSDSGAAEAVRMTYSNNVLAVGTEVLIADSAGTNITSVDPVVAGPDVTQALPADLSDGTYNAVWRVVSSDGHPIEGGFSFHIEAGVPGPIEISPAGPGHDHGDETGDESDHEHGDEPGDESGEATSSPVPGWAVPVSIGAVAVVALAVAIPLIARKREGSAPGETPTSTDSE
ncbi:MAG: copper resistance CopC family protein [Leucobacter sp.]